MKELRLVLLGLAALIAAVLGASFLARAFTHPPHRAVASVAASAPSVQSAPSTEGASPAIVPVSTGPDTAATAEVERSIAGAPAYSRFFDRLRVVFPTDYATILNGVAASTKGNGVNVDLVMADAVAALRRVHGTMATKASDSALEQIFVLQLREMQALAQRDPHLCVAFLYGANGSGFLGFAADHRPLIADAAIAGLDAMNDGRTEQVDRKTPSDDDFNTLDRALVAKGLTRPEIDALLDGKAAVPPIADADMCQAGQTYLETLAALPPDVRGRLYGLAVDLMARF